VALRFIHVRYALEALAKLLFSLCFQRGVKGDVNGHGASLVLVRVISWIVLLWDVIADPRNHTN
ncbi:MAG TPA: hypothetical protein VJ372_18755, partial [Pyrinomonadaceae bacterium]|nr:hypothetical protein [Pyrinomonadaceae bacterium]